jgi:predicted metalloprotease with PDZ domain
LSATVRLKLPNVDGDVERFVERGETVEFTADLLGPCFDKRDVPIPQYEAGFSVRETIEKRVIIGVIEGSAAWRAGLRDGQKTRSLSIRYDDVESDVKFTVEDAEGQIRKMEFRPVKETGELTPQYFLKAGAHGDRACLAWF